MTELPSIILRTYPPKDELNLIRGSNMFLGCFVYRDGQEDQLEEWIRAVGRTEPNEKFVLLNLDCQSSMVREHFLGPSELDAQIEGWSEVVTEKPTPYFWAYAPFAGGAYIYTLGDVRGRLERVRKIAIEHAELLRDAGFDAPA